MDENQIIKSIELSYDWEEVLNQIIVVEGMDPLDIDVAKLTDAFLEYLQLMDSVDFRVPGRFILIAAILIKMKAEILLEKEEEKKAKELKLPEITIRPLPPLEPPVERKPTRKVTLTDLIDALNKAMRFKQRKESRKERLKKSVETLIKIEEEDIESKIERVMNKILSAGGEIKFSQLHRETTRKEIADNFLSLLHLINRGKVKAFQEEMFGEILIKLAEKVVESDAYGNEAS